MNSLYGIPVYPAPWMTETKTTRVRGGYLNRWLIRATVTLPKQEVAHDRINHRIYAHPAVIAQLAKTLHADKVFPNLKEPWRFW